MPAPDRLLDDLRTARPPLTEDACSPASPAASALFARLVREPDAPVHDRPRRRARRLVAVPAIAAAALAAVLLVNGITVDRTGVSVTPPPPAAADIERIAATSATALRSSGRALVDFHLAQGTITEQRITGTVAFSGDDVEMVLQFAPVAGRGSGFEARNRTVDGQFYLYDGPPDARRWYRDLNASATRASDVFSADPRSLLAALHPGVAFEQVGTEQLDGADLRRLRATRIERLPELNLSLGPIDPTHVKGLDIWVGSDDIVRRLDLTLVQVETRSGPGRTEVVVDGDGKQRKVFVPADPGPGGQKGEDVEIRSSASIRFTDIGAPVVITAPAGAVDVRGQG